MKLLAIPILILLLVTQTFSKWMLVVSFNLNREYISRTLCENRSKPTTNCHGKCFLSKKLKQEEKKEQDNSGSVKLEVNSSVLSSRSFFASAIVPEFNDLHSYPQTANAGEPVDRSYPILHPPSI